MQSAASCVQNPTKTPPGLPLWSRLLSCAFGFRTACTGGLMGSFRLILLRIGLGCACCNPLCKCTRLGRWCRSSPVVRSGCMSRSSILEVDWLPGNSRLGSCRLGSPGSRLKCGGLRSVGCFCLNGCPRCAPRCPSRRWLVGYRWWTLDRRLCYHGLRYSTLPNDRWLPKF